MEKRDKKETPHRIEAVAKSSYHVVKAKGRFVTIEMKNRNVKKLSQSRVAAAPTSQT